MPDGTPLPGLAQDKAIKSDSNYIERLQKIIPIEVTGLYFFLSKLVADDDKYDGAFGICILAVMLIMYFGYLPKVQNVGNIGHRVIIIVSFLIWAINIDIDLTQRVLALAYVPTVVIDQVEPTPMAMILAVWTFFVPLVYKGEAT